MENNIKIVNKIGRNTKPEYKKTISRMVVIQSKPGMASSKNTKADAEKKAITYIRNEGK
jgi:hypothetical protein